MTPGNVANPFAKLTHRATAFGPANVCMKAKTPELAQPAPGQQVLDIGSGMGDVAMLAASLVGPSGTVNGIDRDESSLAKARERAVAG